MRVAQPNDLQGRIIRAQRRARALAEGLTAIHDASEEMISDIDAEAIGGFGDIADELADFLRELEEAYVDESNKLYDAAKANGQQPVIGT